MSAKWFAHGLGPPPTGLQEQGYYTQLQRWHWRVAASPRVVHPLAFGEGELKLRRKSTAQPFVTADTATESESPRRSIDEKGAVRNHYIACCRRAFTEYRGFPLPNTFSSVTISMQRVFDATAHQQKTSLSPTAQARRIEEIVESFIARHINRWQHVLNNYFQHGHKCATAGGYVQISEGTFFSTTDSVFLHVWSTSTEAKDYFESHRSLMEASYSFALPSPVRVGLVVLLDYRGRRVTAQPLLPLSGEGEILSERSPLLSIHMQAISAILHRSPHVAGLSAKPGITFEALDGRCYIVPSCELDAASDYRRQLLFQHNIDGGSVAALLPFSCRPRCCPYDEKEARQFLNHMLKDMVDTPAFRTSADKPALVNPSPTSVKRVERALIDSVEATLAEIHTDVECLMKSKGRESKRQRSTANSQLLSRGSFVKLLSLGSQTLDKSETSGQQTFDDGLRICISAVHQQVVCNACKANNLRFRFLYLLLAENERQLVKCREELTRKVYGSREHLALCDAVKQLLVAEMVARVAKGIFRAEVASRQTTSIEDECNILNRFFYCNMRRGYGVWHSQTKDLLLAHFLHPIRTSVLAHFGVDARHGVDLGAAEGGLLLGEVIQRHRRMSPEDIFLEFFAADELQPSTALLSAVRLRQKLGLPLDATCCRFYPLEEKAIPISHHSSTSKLLDAIAGNDEHYSSAAFDGEEEWESAVQNFDTSLQRSGWLLTWIESLKAAEQFQQDMKRWLLFRRLLPLFRAAHLWYLYHPQTTTDEERRVCERFTTRIDGELLPIVMGLRKEHRELSAVLLLQLLSYYPFVPALSICLRRVHDNALRLARRSTDYLMFVIPLNDVVLRIAESPAKWQDAEVAPRISLLHATVLFPALKSWLRVGDVAAKTRDPTLELRWIDLYARHGRLLCYTPFGFSSWADGALSAAEVWISKFSDVATFFEDSIDNDHHVVAAIRGIAAQVILALSQLKSHDVESDIEDILTIWSKQVLPLVERSYTYHKTLFGAQDPQTAVALSQLTTILLFLRRGNLVVNQKQQLADFITETARFGDVAVEQFSTILASDPFRNSLGRCALMMHSVDEWAPSEDLLSLAASSPSAVTADEAPAAAMEDLQIALEDRRRLHSIGSRLKYILSGAYFGNIDRNARHWLQRHQWFSAGCTLVQQERYFGLVFRELVTREDRYRSMLSAEALDFFPNVGSIVKLLLRQDYRLQLREKYLRFQSCQNAVASLDTALDDLQEDEGVRRKDIQRQQREQRQTLWTRSIASRVKARNSAVGQSYLVRQRDSPPLVTQVHRRAATTEAAQPNPVLRQDERQTRSQLVGRTVDAEVNEIPVRFDSDARNEARGRIAMALERARLERIHRSSEVRMLRCQLVETDDDEIRKRERAKTIQREINNGVSSAMEGLRARRKQAVLDVKSAPGTVVIESDENAKAVHDRRTQDKLRQRKVQLLKEAMTLSKVKAKLDHQLQLTQQLAEVVDEETIEVQQRNREVHRMRSKEETAAEERERRLMERAEVSHIQRRHEKEDNAYLIGKERAHLQEEREIRVLLSRLKSEE